MTEKTGAISAVLFILVAFNGLFLFGNGLFMLVAPRAWYYFVPGVTDTGFFNQHFVRDIGIIQMFLGAAFGVGMIRPARRLELWAAATSWLITLPALIGVALTVWAWRTSPRQHRGRRQGLRSA